MNDIEQTVTPEEQAATWPELHDDRATVELAPLWERMPYTPATGVEMLYRLADVAGGTAKRLTAGVDSMLARRDGNVRAWVTTDWDKDLVHIVVWSTAGCWSDREWWVKAALRVSADAFGEIRLTAQQDVTMVVRGQGGTTTFTDSPDGYLGAAVARWYLAWEGRRSVRERMGITSPDLPDEPISLDLFLAGPVRIAEHPKGRGGYRYGLASSLADDNGIDLAEAGDFVVAELRDLIVAEGYGIILSREAVEDRPGEYWVTVSAESAAKIRAAAETAIQLADA